MRLTMSHDFKKKYDRIFEKDPLMANTILVFNSIIDEEDETLFPAINVTKFNDFAKSMLILCPDPRKYAL